MDFHVHQSEDAIYTVYKITGPTGKMYIGCTRTKVTRRWQNGKGYRQRQPYFYADIQKYGWDAFKKEIVCEKLLKEGAENLEKFLVDYYDTCDPEKGYNVFSGGPHKGSVCSAAGRERNSRNVKAAFASNPELMAKMREYRQKEFIEHPETLQKARESGKKRQQNPEYRRKISEARRKYYESHHPQTAPKAVICLDTGEVYRSMSQAEKATGANHGKIGMVCRKRGISAGGLRWEYWEENKNES